MAADVLEAMLPFLADNYGNPSSIHSFGQQARADLEQARAEVTRLLNCRANEVVFTSGGTEADNLAVLGAVRAARARNGGRKHVVTSQIEHHAVLEACQALQKEGVRSNLPAGEQRRRVGSGRCPPGTAPGDGAGDGDVRQ